MIVYPKNWKQVGVGVSVGYLGNVLKDVLERIGCRNLAFSGGLDSSLLLYYMCQMYDPINIFTIGKSEKHPDIVFASKAVEYFSTKFKVVIKQYIYYPKDEDMKGHIDEFPGDRAVELFYKFVDNHVSEIIAGDGVDEFMCGYYAHMERPGENTYYHYLQRLQTEQLVPLDENSGDVKICLPYLDEIMISLMAQIPLKDKVDTATRKKFLVEMAKEKVPDYVIERRKYGFCDALMENKGEAQCQL